MDATKTRKTDAELDDEIDDLMQIIGIQARSMDTRKSKIRTVNMLKAMAALLELLEPN